MGISEEWEENTFLFYSKQQRLGLQTILQVIADRWFCVLPRYPRNIHGVRSPLLPGAHFLHAKLNIMTILSQ